MSAKVLVAAKWLALDRTSEGICSSKFLLALSRAGFDVSCITTDDTVRGHTAPRLPWRRPAPTRPRTQPPVFHLYLQVEQGKAPGAAASPC